MPLEPHSDLTKWLINEGWGKHWGIYVAVEAGQSDMFSMVEHFRQFMVIQNPDNKSAYFRFYDPRVLCVYMPVFDSYQLDIMYGAHIAVYVAEDEDANIRHFRQTNHGLDVAKTELIKSEAGSNAALQ